jgi:uroporphyrinogen decarboxylase
MPQGIRKEVFDFMKPDFDRMATALEGREPDRVPLAEATVAYEIMSGFLGKEVTDSDVASQVEFWASAGYDYIPLTVGLMQPGKVTEDSMISRVTKEITGYESLNGDDAWNLEKRAFIHTRTDCELFPWDDAAKLDLGKFYDVQKHLPEGMKIIAVSGKVFTLTWLLMGFENFCLQLAIDPGFVEAVMERVAQIQFDGLRRVVRIPNVAAVWAVDDIAFGSGTMISPQALRKYVFPWYKKFGEICRDHGMYLLFHSDGILWGVIDDLLEIGIDGLHPIDPTCMDIEEVKERIGDRLCLMGNIPNELLMNGVPEEVIQLTKERIRRLAPGGGYCVGSGNSVPEWSKLENYKAMIDTVMKHGTYPIRL